MNGPKVLLTDAQRNKLRRAGRHSMDSVGPNIKLEMVLNALRFENPGAFYLTPASLHNRKFIDAPRIYIPYAYSINNKKAA